MRLKAILARIVISLTFLPASLSLYSPHTAFKSCSLSPNTNGTDDSPTILDAFERCKEDSVVVFNEGTYHIERVMNTTGLRNVRIDMRGTLLVSLTDWFSLFTI